MKKMISIFVSAVLLGTFGYFGWQQFYAADRTAPVEQPSSRVAGDTLTYPVDAPQLTFLRIMPVKAFPEPLVEPLNARIVYDDNHSARVFSPLSGRVTGIDVETGRQVRAGDALLRIDSPDFATASSDSMKANADLSLKQHAYERARQLLAIQGIALKDYESAEADMHQAEAESLRTKAVLKNLGNHVTTTEGRFILRAPIAGIVSERKVNAGSEVRPDAADPLFVITDPRHLWVLVDLPEQELDKVRTGQPVLVEVDAYPGEVFHGKVTVIGEAMDPVTRRIQVRCYVDNAQLKLKPEMFARVTPIADKQSDLPRIPNTALVTQGLYTYLFVEKALGVLQRRRVSLATQDSDFSYVKEGVSPGERIVTTGALLLNSELAGND
ncbi:MAG: efflux RND transporter periplasmic adaptor subunit [Gallionella sp.]